MKICLTGSRELTEIDKEEIQLYLKRYGKNHEIHILCDKTVEFEVLKYFIENDEHARNLSLYTFQPHEMLPKYLKDPIEYLRDKGASYTSFEMKDVQITRAPYAECLKRIYNSTNLLICFYNGDSPKRLIPVDVAKEVGIDAMIYELPRFNKEKTEKSLEHKVRVV